VALNPVALHNARVDHGPVRGREALGADPRLSAVYSELRALAGSLLRRQTPGQTLQPTALVHDAWLRLAARSPGDWESRGHFVSVAAMAMRQILVDHTRRRRALKRGGNRQRVELDDVCDLIAGSRLDVLALDEALQRLAAVDARRAQVVELKFFGGLTNEQVAEHLDISRATVADDWAVARAWLRRALASTHRADGTGDGSSPN